MCMLNESVCILCYIQICLDENIYDPSVSVTYAKLFCTHVGIVTVRADPYARLCGFPHAHKKPRFDFTYLVVTLLFFLFQKRPQFSIIIIIIIIHSLTTFNWNPWLIFGSVLT